MSMACSTGYSAVALDRGALADRAAMRGLIRWAVLGAAGVIALVLALTHAMTASAATPAGCIPINYTTCVTTGTAYVAPTTTTVPTYVGGNVVAVAPANSGYPPNTVVRSYYDPRYGFVSVVTDASGNLIDVNSATGQRIYPVYPDYGVGFVGANYYNGNFIGANYLNGNVIAGNVYNGNFAYGNAYNGNYVNGAFPAGGTVVGGVVYYNDNRFCTDGKVAFVPGRGYFCQNGGPLVPNGTGTVHCSNFFVNGCGIWTGYEANTTTTTTTTAPAQQVSAYAADAKAPAVAPAAPVAAPAA